MSATWKFPERGEFNIQDKDGTFMGCRVVDEDVETITFDYTANLTAARMRTQILKDDIRSISWPVREYPTAAEVDQVFR